MSQTIDKLPTSTFEVFKQQLDSPNTPFTGLVQDNTGEKVKIQKNLVLSFPSDSTGCGHIRNVFPMTYLNATFGKSGRFNLLTTPIMIFQITISIINLLSFPTDNFWKGILSMLLRNHS